MTILNEVGMATPTSKKSLSSQKKITCGNTNFKGSSTAKPETKRGTKKHEQQTQRCDICLEAIEEAIGNNSGQDAIFL